MLMNKIKEDQLNARKASDKVKAQLLTTLIGEASIIGKNDGDRQTSDNEVITVIKKFVKNIDECLGVYAQGTENFNLSTIEKSILTEYLPKQMSEAEIEKAIHAIVDGANPGSCNLGKVMAALKKDYDGTYDGKIASHLAKKIVG